MATQKQRRHNEIKEKSSETSIDDLPETILSHIISFLPAESAVQTTIVGPAWRDLWHFIPELTFNMFLFHCRIPHLSVRTVRQRFAEFTTETLRHRPHHLSFQKFELFICYKNSFSIWSQVSFWLQRAISSKAVEIDLTFESEETYVRSINQDLEEENEYHYEKEPGYVSHSFKFRLPLLENSKVQVLKLRDCDLSMPRKASPPKFDSIKELLLEAFCFAHGRLEDLIASCPNLEVLSLRDGSSHEFKIVSRKLKHLNLGGFKMFVGISLEICAPSLESINFSSVFAEKLTLRDTASLVEVTVGFPDRSWQEFVSWSNLVVSLGAVERLTTQNMWPWALYDPNAENMRRKPNCGCFVAGDEEYLAERQPRWDVVWGSFTFHNLKHVEVLTGYCIDDIIGLKILLRKCQNLVTLVLVHSYLSSIINCEDILEATPIAFQIPCIRLVEMKEYRKTTNEAFVVGILKKHGVVLDKIVAYPVKVNGRSGPSIVL